MSLDITKITYEVCMINNKILFEADDEKQLINANITVNTNTGKVSGYEYDYAGRDYFIFSENEKQYFKKAALKFSRQLNKHLSITIKGLNLA